MGTSRILTRAPVTMGLALATSLLAIGCSPSSEPGPTPDQQAASPDPRESTSQSHHAPYDARLTVLGDSNASTTSCPGCTIFPEQLADAVGTALAAKVELVNLAWEITNPKAAQVADIVRYVKTDRAARETLTGSDAVVILVSQNDLAYNRGDDPCRVAPAYPAIRWRDLTHECIDETLHEYQRDLEELLDEIDRLRAGRPTMLRIVSAYNTAIGDTVDPTWNSPAAIEPSAYNVAGMAAIQCRLAKEHDGKCADALHALNGRDGRQSAQAYLNPFDATHLAQSGHDLIAEVVIDTGFGPLRGS